MATGTTTAAPPRNDLHFTKGDMVIVSSNNVKFKVDSLTALAARYVTHDKEPKETEKLTALARCCATPGA